VLQGLPLPHEVFFETLKAPSVKLMEITILMVSLTHNEDWRTKIITFLQRNHPIDDEVYAKWMQARTRPYKMIEGGLYKGVFARIYSSVSLETKVKS
jgi:hypothetical protein